MSVTNDRRTGILVFSRCRKIKTSHYRDRDRHRGCTAQQACSLCHKASSALLFVALESSMISHQTSSPRHSEQNQASAKLLTADGRHRPVWGYGSDCVAGQLRLMPLFHDDLYDGCADDATAFARSSHHKPVAYFYLAGNLCLYASQTLLTACLSLV